MKKPDFAFRRTKRWVNLNSSTILWISILAGVKSFTLGCTGCIGQLTWNRLWSIRVNSRMSTGRADRTFSNSTSFVRRYSCVPIFRHISHTKLAHILTCWITSRSAWNFKGSDFRDSNLAQRLMPQIVTDFPGDVNPLPTTHPRSCVTVLKMIFASCLPFQKMMIYSFVSFDTFTLYGASVSLVSYEDSNNATNYLHSGRGNR